MAQSDIMSLAEVAGYLRVSERAVTDWAQKGVLPAARVEQGWLFRRAEIEPWANAKLARCRDTGGSAPADLSLVLAPDRVLIGDYASKPAALDALIECLAHNPLVGSRDELAAAIYQREALMSTGIGMGVAVPHVRLTSVSDVVMAALVSRRDIGDYESLDGQPVRLVFMIAAGLEQQAHYLKVLSAIAARIKDPASREALLRAVDAGAFCDILAPQAAAASQA